MLNLKNKRISIVGGGEVAYRKALTLLEYCPDIRVISTFFLDKFNELSDKLELINEPYRDELIKDSFLVIAATSSKEVNGKIAQYCRDNKILVNLADNPDASDFIVPSSFKRGDLVISVSTSGKSPSLAAKIKREIEKQYGDEYAKYIEVLGDIRDILLKRCPDNKLRSKILKELIYLSPDELIKRRAEYENCSWIKGE
ncbi:precorrin-2 dehydrogenase/sirohydrochlorin ferrochelatase family protein [Fonticella tunisiensis]|uniref:precorrin-2 dehydrogenase n=1 Tax=Fonticella tunisiensis TaxID=1096341 RepID=A0A4R7KL89_9CLOT|nr:bifunctional precorrin-2 dehydrogenase/sirohydrochlorin ferrochelatase [Fonticella tunisiensis]TDT56465.1 precorrin-2 dehydrogenase/sirohydrochlorin ferrochelatase [Fonticella tunisiensis]